MTDRSVVFFFFLHPQGCLALWNISGKSPPEDARYDTDIPLILPSLFISRVLSNDRSFFHPQISGKTSLYISIVPAKLNLLFAVHTDVPLSSTSASLLYEVLVWPCLYLPEVRKTLLDVSIVLAQLYSLFAVHADACLLSLSILQLSNTWPFPYFGYVGETSLGYISLVLAQLYILFAVLADSLLPTTQASQVSSMLKSRTFKDNMSLANLSSSAVHDVIEGQVRYPFSLLRVFCQSLLPELVFSVDDRLKRPIFLTLVSGSTKAVYPSTSNSFCLPHPMVSGSFFRENLETPFVCSCSLKRIILALFFRAAREKKATPGPCCPVRHSLWPTFSLNYFVTVEAKIPWFPSSLPFAALL